MFNESDAQFHVERTHDNGQLTARLQSLPCSTLFPPLPLLRRTLSTRRAPLIGFRFSRSLPLLAAARRDARVRPFPAYQREAFWVLDRFHRQIDVEVRPIQMVGMRKLHVQQSADRNVSEPGKLMERHEKFPTSKQKPKSVLRDVRYLNLRSVLSKLRRSHLRVPELGGLLC